MTLPIYASALNRIRPGKASDFFDPWDSLRHFEKVIICARTSPSDQDRSKQLAGQAAWLRDKARPLQLEILKVVPAKGITGSDLNWLPLVAADAKRQGAALLFESVDRAIRSHRYDKRNQDAQPNKAELEYFQWVTGGVRCVSWLPSDSTPSEIRSHQTKRGIWWDEICRIGYKKWLQENWLNDVLRMRDYGAPIRDISTITGIPKSTIARWIKTADFHGDFQL